MRNSNILVSFVINFPVGKPDKNGVVYTREAVAKALESMPVRLPIMDLKNDGDGRVIGAATSKPYAVQWDGVNGVCRFTIDGTILFGGTSCIVNAMNDAGEITDFTFTGIGISE